MKQLLAQVPIGDISGFGRFNPSESGGAVVATTQVENVFTMIFGFLTIVAGLSFLIYFLIGAINWVTAGGDSKKVDTAKSYMTNGAIGMIAIIASYAIISIVGTVLGFEILNPAQTLINITDSTGAGSNSTQNPTVPGAQGIR